jgi:hypothetical protein
MTIEYSGRALRWRQIAAPVQTQAVDAATRPRVPVSVKKRKWTPAANHPWHEPARPEVQKRAAKMAAGPVVGLALRFALNASPLRATQGCALGQATDRKNLGCHGPCAIEIVAPSAS